MKQLHTFVQTLVAVLVAVAMTTAMSASAAITPPTTPVPSAPNTIRAFTLYSPGSTLSATSQNSISADVSQFSVCSVQYVMTTTLVQGVPNTATLTFQGSNNNRQYVDFNAAAASTVISSTALVFFNNPVMRYVRLKVALSNTNPIGFEAIGFCR